MSKHTKGNSEDTKIAYLGLQLPIEVMNKLRLLAEKEDRSVSYLVRRILKEYTEK
jgi:predicted DNA-binding protein